MGVPVGISAPPLGKTRMVSLPDGEKISKICLFVLTWSMNVTDRQTDGRTDTAWQQCIASQVKQELSYRKQIARQLRTQFVEGISVTLKSTSRVTQGHWKRNHWRDHTRLTVRRVIRRWILSWPWNVSQRSLMIIESGTIWKFRYGFLTFRTLNLTLTLTLTLTLW